MTAQTNDHVEARLRDLFAQQARAIPVSPRTATDVPITYVTDDDKRTRRSRWTRSGTTTLGAWPQRDRRRTGALALISTAAVVAAIVTVVALTSGTARRRPAGGPATSPPRAITFSLQLVLGKSSPPCTGATIPGSGQLHGCYTLGATVVDLADVQSARAIHETSPGWIVSVSFTKAATPRFDSAMEADVGRDIAIVIDGRVIMAPRVYAGITGGTISIYGGNIDEQTAKQLAARLTKPQPPRPTPGATSPIVLSPAIGTTRTIAFSGLHWTISAKSSGGSVCVRVARTTGTRYAARSELGPGAPAQCVGPVSTATDGTMHYAALDLSTHTKMMMFIGGHGEAMSVSFDGAPKATALASSSLVFVVLYPESASVTGIDFLNANGSPAESMECQQDTCP